jgi:hypothetical protein
MFWTIVLIGAGALAPSVTYLGVFEQAEACQTALKDLKAQNFKGTCVQSSRQEPVAKK